MRFKGDWYFLFGDGDGPLYVEKTCTARAQINFQISAALHHPVNGHREGVIFRAYHSTKRRLNLVAKTNVLLGGAATSFATRRPDSLRRSRMKP